MIEGPEGREVLDDVGTKAEDKAVEELVEVRVDMERPDKFFLLVVQEIFLAGSETTSSTIEWAMTELLCNPKKMIKAKAELIDIVGPNRKMEESDIDGLPYLQAVVKETLRLHPPIPFLVPRKAIQDTNFMGYHIPKNTKVLINTWAIGRDPECWDDPMEFKPERFLDSKTDYKGQHYELIPFGAGRRMCAGVPLAHRMLHLVLGSLLHEFEWNLNGQVTAETMDRKERMGVTVRKFEPLMAVSQERSKPSLSEVWKEQPSFEEFLWMADHFHHGGGSPHAEDEPDIMSLPPRIQPSDPERYDPAEHVLPPATFYHFIDFERRAPVDLLLREPESHLSYQVSSRSTRDYGSILAIEWYTELPDTVRHIVDEAGFGPFCAEISRYPASRTLMGALMERW
ncbi:cytochrome P450 76A1-like [Camellia sinensis]|uniref:cytochrome P450 76A1-like n=1 Tax=Camellia sinensis TaxID=4442 RepID=UPI001035F778|nr:cytochrome P450 76A1-like [Camellia sinensis]